MAFVLDEGFSGLSHDYGRWVFSLGMAEKGYLDAVVKVEMPGGHSSVPPPHTASECDRQDHLSLSISPRSAHGTGRYRSPAHDQSASSPRSYPLSKTALHSPSSPHETHCWAT